MKLGNIWKNVRHVGQNENVLASQDGCSLYFLVFPSDPVPEKQLSVCILQSFCLYVLLYCVIFARFLANCLLLCWPHFLKSRKGRRCSGIKIPYFTAVREIFEIPNWISYIFPIILYFWIPVRGDIKGKCDTKSHVTVKFDHRECLDRRFIPKKTRSPQKFILRFTRKVDK